MNYNKTLSSLTHNNQSYTNHLLPITIISEDRLTLQILHSLSSIFYYIFTTGKNKYYLILISSIILSSTNLVCIK